MLCTWMFESEFSWWNNSCVVSGRVEPVEYSNIRPQVPLLRVPLLIGLVLCDRWGGLWYCYKQKLLFMEMTSWAISRMGVWAESHQNNFISYSKQTTTILSSSKTNSDKKDSAHFEDFFVVFEKNQKKILWSLKTYSCRFEKFRRELFFHVRKNQFRSCWSYL